MTHVFDANLGYNRVETLDNKREGRKSLWICSGFKLCQPTLLPQPYSKKTTTETKPLLLLGVYVVPVFIQICIWKAFASQTAK